MIKNTSRRRMKNKNKYLDHGLRDMLTRLLSTCCIVMTTISPSELPDKDQVSFHLCFCSAWTGMERQIANGF